MNDTIAAISSSGGPIGLIRVSGERAIEAINAVFQAKNGKPLTEAPSQKLVYGTLTDKSGNVIDCCYAVALHAPHTYTGETMAELQCHGSTAVLCAGLDALFAQGVRQAEAGEFTRRAFLNGKMGLSEAEAVHDLITARTAEAAQNAAAQVMGAVGSPVQQMRDELLGMVAHFHAVVDFPDEDIDPVLFEDAAALLHRTTSRLYSMAESYERGRILREGVPCVILGRPNAGKSTLLKLAAGLEEPDTGSCTKANHVVIRYLPQTPEFDDSCTVWEHVEKKISESTQWDMEGEAKSMLRTLGIVRLEQKISELSGGQRKRLALAEILMQPCDILVLDEPTNHLDHAMAAWLEDYLKCWRGSLIMVTHDRYFLDSVSNRIVEIDKGKIYSYQTNYSGYLELKTQRQEMEAASERKRQSILRVELEWIRRGARARSTKQKAHIQRYEALRDQKKPDVDKKIEIGSVSSRMGKTTVELSHITKTYGDHVLISDFS